MVYSSVRKDGVVYSPALNFRSEGEKGLGHFFYDSCKKNGDKVFQIDGLTGRSETYSTILEKSVRIAIEMRKMGLQQGDIILICSTNNMDTILPVFAATYLNVIISAIDPSLSLRDSVYLLNSVQPKMIFAEATAMNLIEDILKQIKFKTDVVVMGSYKKYIPFNQFLKAQINEDQFRPVELKSTGDIAVIFFSSGTTGMPKGVKASHYGLLYGMSGMRQMDMCGKATIHFSSFYWISAHITTLLTVIYGGYKVIVSAFDPTLTMNLIQKYKITFAFMPAITIHSFSKENTTGYDTSSLMNLVFAGSSTSDDKIKQCRSYFPNALISNGYGQTEASNFITIFSKSEINTLAMQHPGSSGVPIPGINVKIVDPETEEILPPNQQGEIRIQSGGIFLGYHNHPDSGNAIDPSGFLKTGDIGYLNDDNCLFVCDRLKDMFTYRNWHVVPASVERIVYLHPAVQETIVIGIPHPEDGHHPMALVVLKKQYSDVNEEDLLSFVNANVLDREKLRGGLRIISSLPKTVTGKIIRRQIRKAVIEGEML